MIEKLCDQSEWYYFFMTWHKYLVKVGSQEEEECDGNSDEFDGDSGESDDNSDEFDCDSDESDDDSYECDGNYNGEGTQEYINKGAELSANLKNRLPDDFYDENPLPLYKSAFIGFFAADGVSSGKWYITGISLRNNEFAFLYDILKNSGVPVPKLK